MMVKVSDYVFKRLHEVHGINHVFLVTGGGAMHLNDSTGSCPGITYICNHHEQASAIAAEGYYRALGKLCVTSVTTGPGGTNAVTGVLGQWTDSIPGIYISGQVKVSTTVSECPELNLRQLGDQEVNIVDIVRPITKLAHMITDPHEVKYYIDKAVHTAVTGRPGPVWLDIPLNIQGAFVEESEMIDFVPETEHDFDLCEEKSQQVALLAQKLKEAKRPVFYLGNGLRLSDTTGQILSIARQFSIPVVTAISGHDLLGHDDPLFFGKPGICGDRLGNIMVQNSDLLVVLGTRLSIRQIGYAYDLLAPGAFKAMVDIDNGELHKPTLSMDLPIHCDLRAFVPAFGEAVRAAGIGKFTEWCDWGRSIAGHLPSLIDDNPLEEGYVNSFLFASRLLDQLRKGDVMVTGNGTAYTSTYQAMSVKEGVRVFANQGCAAMGYDLPAAIGASVTNKDGRTVLVTGDGSIQMNIQELQTLQTYHLPLKIFLLNNDGYLAIKTTQKSFFEGRFVGSNPASGVVCPDMCKIADAYGIPYIRVTENDQLEEKIAEALNTPSAVICEIMMNPGQTLFPKASSFMDEKGQMQSHPLEKMFPFLGDELQEECSRFARKK